MIDLLNIFVLFSGGKTHMINRFKYSLYRFMVGRYGNDVLGYTLLGFSFFFSFSASFFGDYRSIVVSLSYIPLAYEMFRFFSRNIYKRQRENAFFLSLLKPFRKEGKRVYLNATQKDFKHYQCPHCAQLIRVPAHRGRIEISCPHCRKTFTKKT